MKNKDIMTKIDLNLSSHDGCVGTKRKKTRCAEMGYNMYPISAHCRPVPFLPTDKSTTNIIKSG